MCLILFSYQPHSRQPLVLLANRDEFYRRPTAAAGWWPEQPQLLAGRDLQGGGTWLGLSRTGRFAALTNFRDRAAKEQTFTSSRGQLVRDFLLGQQSPDRYLHQLLQRLDDYAAFNLLAGDGSRLWYLSSRQGRVCSLAPGLYGLSNHHLDSDWPKVRRGKAALAQALSSGAGDEELLGILGDRQVVADSELPDTGFGLEWERILAPLFIHSPDYGTRCSTLVKVSGEGDILLLERSYSAVGPDFFSDQRHEFRLQRDDSG